MLFNYKGSMITASSKEEAISKIVAGIDKFTKQQLLDTVNFIKKNTLKNIYGISKSVVVKSTDELAQLDVIVKKIGKNINKFTIYVENNHNVVVNFADFDPDNKDREFTYTMKSINDLSFHKVIDCIVAIIRAYEKYEDTSMDYDAYIAILNKWDNR